MLPRPSSPEHRRLAVGLNIADDLEEIQLGGRSDDHDGQAQVSLSMVVEDGSVEDLTVECPGALGVLGQHSYVIDPGE
jgi:hypothetical protein